MIARLSGTVTDVGLVHIIIDVGGVGFFVHVTSVSGFTSGTPATLFTYLAVRENALDLYGFGSAVQLNMFHELIKIPKIGPKTALQILSQAEVEVLRHAVQTQDATYLSKMSGIGKKSAEKIVAGLKDSIGDDAFIGTSQHSADADVIDALISLGYSQRDTIQAVGKIPPEITDTNSRVKQALKYLSL